MNAAGPGHTAVTGGMCVLLALWAEFGGNFHQQNNQHQQNIDFMYNGSKNSVQLWGLLPYWRRPAHSTIMICRRYRYEENSIRCGDGVCLFANRGV